MPHGTPISTTPSWPRCVHGDEPLVIVAGAGTGKTRTLTARVARLLERGVAPERILLLTFTRRAADDMLARAASLSGHREWARRLRGGTFHAVAHQFISAYAEPLGLQPGFSLLDPADAADVMDLLREEQGLDAAEVRVPRSATLVEVYSRCVNTRHRLGEVLATDFPWCEPHAEAIAGLFRAYVARKREQGPGRLRRPLAVVAGRARRRPARAAAWPRCSTTCSSTSTRT